MVARYALNGCLTEHDGSPARWIRTLARAAEAAGGSGIHDGTTVEGPVPAPGEGELRTPGGSVAARHVVVASDVRALPAPCPSTPRALAAAPHDGHRAAPRARDGPARLFALGLRVLPAAPDGRLLIGGFMIVKGEASYTDSDEGSPAIWERIKRHIREDLGLDPVITHRWAGVVGYSDDALRTSARRPPARACGWRAAGGTGTCRVSCPGG